MLEPIKRKLSELELITAIREKKRVGAEVLYDEHALTLLKVIYCSVRDQRASEFILEDVFQRIWHNIDDYEPLKGRLIIWMAGIARSTAKASMALTPTTISIDTNVQQIPSIGKVAAIIP